MGECRAPTFTDYDPMDPEFVVPDRMTEPMYELVFVRHAAATGQEPTAALTIEGEQQAEVLADLLMRFRIQRVIASPFVRATASVAPFCRRADLRVEIDERLVERVLSARSLADWQEHLRRSFDDLDYRLDDGESSRMAQARGIAAVHAALAAGQRCMLVTHGNLLALILRYYDATFGFDQWSRLSNPDAFVLQFDDDRPTGFRRVWSVLDLDDGLEAGRARI